MCCSSWEIAEEGVSIRSKRNVVGAEDVFAEQSKIYMGNLKLHLYKLDQPA